MGIPTEAGTRGGGRRKEEGGSLEEDYIMLFHQDFSINE